MFTTAADVAVGWRLLTSYVTLRFLQIFCCCYYDVSLAHAQNNTQQVFFLFLVVDVSLIPFVEGGMQMMWAEGVTYAVGDDLFSFRLSSLELC